MRTCCRRLTRPSCTRPITSRESHAPRFACVACRPRRSSALAADPACDSARPFGSFLDVYSLSGYMPRRFKYISKVENLRLPIIGWAMSMAQHITLGRADRASQVKTLKDAIESLSNGNSLVVFPEVSTPRLAVCLCGCLSADRLRARDLLVAPSLRERVRGTAGSPHSKRAPSRWRGALGVASCRSQLLGRTCTNRPASVDSLSPSQEACGSSSTHPSTRPTEARRSRL